MSVSVGQTAIGNSLRALVYEYLIFFLFQFSCLNFEGDVYSTLMPLIMKELSFLVLTFKSWNILQKYGCLKISTYPPKSGETVKPYYIMYTCMECA